MCVKVCMLTSLHSHCYYNYHSLSLKAIIDKDEMSSQETHETCEYSPVKQKVNRWHFLEIYQVYCTSYFVLKQNLF